MLKKIPLHKYAKGFFSVLNIYINYFSAGPLQTSKDLVFKAT
jgi:hypothetical protein